MDEIVHIASIEKIHKTMGLPKPKHPLVSLVYMRDFPPNLDFEGVRFTSDLYMISLKDGVEGSIQYGKSSYDFSDGTMVFMKPQQVIHGTSENICANSKGWMLLVHPDLIRKSELGRSMSQYTYFDYEVNEALHLSEEEQMMVSDLVQKIELEYQQNIDQHSQKLIISNLELLLNYCTRYYDRQFYVRTNLNQDHVSQFETLLKAYFNSGKAAEFGIPSVKYCGEELHMSPNYLSDLLKKETGKSAKDHIHTYVVNRAKNNLLGTTDSISEIAYDLGFEYPQHFSKLFKSKTGMSPAQYRTQN
ncbi:helix-turn-helix domain-containing protein [Muricauda sp. 2012CJ35-5]|uniref:Helix-turn-helix domain-containing protein n=1 Tax=Flagellimonas spongiicola TaxID=2942208 RepID=A0ABT0PPM3_9FLAO|nr:helix-turn-helix domain-containing protein [Allomuricauda spongiicola]MCL6273347.1 helix-turn-helix domain-containing protein [Allomuricauda spongiicola]